MTGNVAVLLLGYMCSQPVPIEAQNTYVIPRKIRTKSTTKAKRVNLDFQMNKTQLYTSKINIVNS